ncbi:VOC family protein [Lihuaxuella thermophila]|uniref:Glyoxalase/Bleomycin resistance protein/Dioxygenase superfamily protein n=1 Tax=Lihuaxuella thermophila TaxID=1173111 RepID=A0A1H8IPT3_9BACL|nr:VOC family protein [Lihuaxuella thermophila]SEN70930.1 Glyoxalase/Bleomycin resistance protein/Dioxygenase superfamily protein [Lihuaxuella thermophila]
MIQVSFSHLDYNVADLQKAMSFYDPVMEVLGFVKEAHQPAWCLYNNQRFKLCLVECEDAFKGAGFHRKRPGLNHLAFHVEKKGDVDQLHHFLLQRKIPILYGGPGQFHDEIEYYAIFFEDPFRLKLEVVYSPRYFSI